MADQHPITPPPELVQQWKDNWVYGAPQDVGIQAWLVTQAAKWGADQELEACCEYITGPGKWRLAELRAARRPKPPSLAEQALFAIDEEQADLTLVNYKVIRAALERLKELEQSND